MPFALKLPILVVTSTLPLVVQGQQITSKPAPTAPEVVTINGSNQYDSRRDDTATRIVIDREEIAKYGDSNILDVMKRLPGITVSGASGYGRGAQIQMRGLGNGYTQVLVDGERPPASFSLETINPASVERIEILRAASAEFSTQSIAGTINIVLKKVVSTAAKEIKTGIGGGSGTRTPSANFSWSDKSDALSYSVASNLISNRFDRTLFNHDEFTSNSGEMLASRDQANHERGHFDGLSVTPRFNWKVANGDTVSLNSFVNFARFRRHIDTATAILAGGQPDFPTVDQLTWFDEKFAKSDLLWSHRLEGNARIDLKIGGSYSRNTNGIDWSGYNQTQEFRKKSVTRSDGIDKTLTTTGKYSRSLGAGHSFLSGWDVSYTNREDKRTQREIAALGVPQANNYDIYSADLTRLAVFAQDEWNVTPQLSTYLGGRWEQIKISASGNTFPDVTSTTGVLSPIFQTLYKFGGKNGDQLRFAITRTFKAPGIRQILPSRIVAVNNSALEPDLSGSPRLKPERAVGFDGSYEHRFAQPGALISLSTSIRKISDVIRQEVSLDSDGRWVSLPTNSGSALAKSVEVEVKFPLKAIWKESPEVDLRTSFSRNWSTVDVVPGPHNRLAEQTPYTANFGFDYKLTGLTVGGMFVIRGGGPARVSIEQDRYQNVRRDLDLYALWKINGKTSLRMTASHTQEWAVENMYSDGIEYNHGRTQVNPKSSSARIILEHNF